MNSESLELRPAPSLQELAQQFWRQLANSEQEKKRIAGKFRQDYWWAVWEDPKLRIKRQQTGLPGAAFGGGLGVAATPTLGAPIVEYDGEAITATGLSGDDSTFDEAAEMMVELAKLLKEQSRESGWACVKVSGTSKAVRKLKDKLGNDLAAPSVYDAEIAAAVEGSRGRDADCNAVSAASSADDSCA